MGETAALLQLLQRHYIKPSVDLPGGVFVPEVGVNGSWGKASRCDAIYVGFTTSSSRLLVGHELKISRADWLAELKTPGKADAWADECHEWWIVVPNPAIIHDGELPAGWGLMYPGRSKTRMAVHTPAARKDPAQHRPSWDAVRSVIARLDTLRASSINEGRRRAVKDADDQLEERVQRGVAAELAQRGPDAAAAAERLKLIEEALGAPVDFTDNDWTAYGHIDLDDLAKIGRAAQALGDLSSAARTFAQPWGDRLDGIRSGLRKAEDAIAELRTLAETAAMTGGTR